jgi:hypothetical protein
MNMLSQACYLLVVFLLTVSVSKSQPNTTIDLAKPKQYSNRSLPAEKTGDKKFTLPRRIYQNTTARFNYYFNANKRLNEVIERARAAHKDDYTQLLSFYDYSLDAIPKDETDSIIYKCNAGILLHDLRSDWVDNLYMLMGQAYLLRKDFDSATAVFRYINYAFAPKDDVYDLPLGSNASNSNGVFTIATDETRSFLKRITTTLPSRNESFIWQLRTYLEQRKTAEAAGLLEILRTDPKFPQRLQTSLHEMTDYWFYQQEVYDSAAYHLTKALNNALSKQTIARWEYLSAQLYQLARKGNEAIQLFERSIRHTTDPLMEIYARLNIVTLPNGKKDTTLQENLAGLLKMARRDKYEAYRDIIYYTAAKLELQQQHEAAAARLLFSSIKFSNDNPGQKQQSFLLLGDLNYDRKAYAAAYRYYDSVEAPLLRQDERERITARKPALQIITENEIMIHREDSLQKLALLAPAERNAAAKKALRQLRKEKGLKYADADSPSGGDHLSAASSLSDLFNNSSADFYFLNASLKARGEGEFRNKWGNRPNTDNWRRQSALARSYPSETQVTRQKVLPENKPLTEIQLTLEALLANIPLTSAQQDLSTTTTIKALLGNAIAFQHQLEDYPSAIGMYETFLKRFPESAEVEKALFNLSICYQKTDAFAKADSVRNILNTLFRNGQYTVQLHKVQPGNQAEAASRQYESIYRLFIEGQFDAARNAKLIADKQFGKSYWTPQLLYIESVWYIKQHQDSLAIDRLQEIVSLFAKSAMAARAATMMDVLKRRAEIESYLANLNIQRQEDVVIRGIDLNAPVTAAITVKKQDTFAVTTAPKEIRTQAPPTDKKTAVISNEVYTFTPTDTHYVMIIMDKVDPVFVSESRNAFIRFNRERYTSQQINSTNIALTKELNLLLIGPFANAGTAVSYIEAARSLSKTQIIPWLPLDKYSFTIISPTNLSILQNNKDMAGFRTFMQKILPD